MKIGLLSDTHGYLDPKVFDHFGNCDEIWHAGDIGDPLVAEQLRNFRPVRAVFGNIDNGSIRSQFPEDAFFSIDGLSVWMTHIAGSPPNYNARVKKILAARCPDVLVCGHSHILKIAKDPLYTNMIFINPGAAGNHGFHNMKTLVRFDIREKKIENLEVIEIGRRGVIK